MLRFKFSWGRVGATAIFVGRLEQNVTVNGGSTDSQTNQAWAGYSHPLLEVLHQCVLPLFVMVPKAGWKWLGTAFVVAHQGDKDALLVTAAHVLRQANEYGVPRRHHPSTPRWLVAAPTPAINQEHPPKAYVGIPQKGGYQLAEVIDFWFSEEIDFGMLAAVIPSETDAAFTGRLALDMSPVRIGTKVIAVGYPKMTVEYGADGPEPGISHITVETLFEFRPGTVTELCPQGTTMYQGAGFRVDCPFDHGMSGGPIIEIEGERMTVRGLISGDRTEQADDERRGSGAHAFASMLLPALVTNTHVGIEGRDGPVRLIDLVRQGIIDERGGALEHIRIEELRDGRFTVSWIEAGP